MRNTSIQFPIYIAAICLMTVGCRKSSGHSGDEQKPVIPIVTPSEAALTEAECASKANDLLGSSALKDTVGVPQNLKNPSMAVAMAVSNGKLDARCLDYTYQSGH